MSVEALKIVGPVALASTISTTIAAAYACIELEQRNAAASGTVSTIDQALVSLAYFYGLVGIIVWVRYVYALTH